MFTRDAGRDRVRDFDVHEDRLLIEGDNLEFLGFDDFMSMARQSGHDVVFDNGQGLQIVLQNTQLDELSAEMFMSGAMVDSVAML